jgi:signal transduction histidine kinase
MSNELRAAILVVDDTQANLVALRALLKPLGEEVVTASSGLQALELAAARDFSVILLDLMMPGLNGLDTLTRLRALDRAVSTPVIFLTAYHPERELMERAYALGALDFIEKPIAIELLRGKVSAFVALHEKTEQIRRQADALQIKDRHISILAHDLRNPLYVIMTAAQLIEAEEASAPDTAALISRSAGRMERLIENLLHYARSAEAKFKPKPERLDMTSLCAEIVNDVQTVYPDVSFKLDLCPAIVGQWDRLQLEQAVSNLLVNAAKYGDGAVSLHLSQDAGLAVLVVANGGAPIPSEQMAQLFAAFARGANSRSGVGLGLYVIREVALAHGGDVTAASDETETRFTLSLPL